VDRPTILVMGNEGYGLRTTVRRVCDATLRIDGAPGAGAAAGQGVGARARAARQMVDSLNVSVATGILLHQLLAPKE
jgi:21S rRNA (GM2251-2'-O)-methyltransferase